MAPDQQPPRKRTVTGLSLIYDADSGVLSAVADSARKLFRIGGCSLCSITHGLAGERDTWRDCREALGVPVDSYHRDELDAELERLVGGSLPAVVAQIEADASGRTERVVLLGPDVLDRSSGTVDDFRGRLAHYANLHDLEIPGLV